MSGQMLTIAKKMREIKPKKDNLEKGINNKFQRAVRRDEKQYSGDKSTNTEVKNKSTQRNKETSDQ